MLNITPCKGCTTRFVGCHQYCDEYKEWRRLNTAAHRSRQKEAEVTTALHEMKANLAHKYGKAHGRKKS